MNLIERLYESSNVEFESDEKAYIYFNDLDDVARMTNFLKYARCFDTDLSYEEFDNNIVKLFNKLGFVSSSIFLHNMVVRKSKCSKNLDGFCTFDYSVDSLDCINGNTLGYYSSGELFDGENSKYPGVKLSSGNTSLYYTVGTGPYIKKYEIKVNDKITLTREFSNHDVVFIITNKDGSSFVIRIKKPFNKVVTSNYMLDNELELVDSLQMISTYDVANIYDMLCELSLGNNISIYPEITLSELVRTENGIIDKNLLTIANGNLECAVRSINDKRLVLYGNGNWKYTISDENVNFSIDSGKTLKYGIETKNDKMMGDYLDSLVKYDVSVAKREVEDTKKLVRSLGIGVKRRG